MCMILRLPPELLRAVVEAAADSLIVLATCCRLLCDLTDSVARELSGAEAKGLWCEALSWRAMYYGRRMRSSTRVRKQLGLAGSTRSARRAGQAFSRPTAIACFGDEAAVCNAQARTIAVVSLRSGDVKQTVAVDGVPCGICALPEACGGPARGRNAPFAFAVAVQGVDESGEAIAGVSNSSHRVERFWLGGEAGAAEDAALPWQDASAELSFPTGLCATLRPARSPEAGSAREGGTAGGAADGLEERLEVHCADWNHHRYACMRPFVRSAPLYQVVCWELRGDQWLGAQQFARPADVAAVSEGIVAMVDYYGGGLWLIGEVMAGGGWGVLRCDRGAAKGKFDRPSGVVADRWGRLLVAEAGAMRVSVLRVRPPTAEAAAAVEHACDICTEQLGTGLHAPTRGEWSWLALDCTAAGDIVVADCDNNCVHVI